MLLQQSWFKGAAAMGMAQRLPASLRSRLATKMQKVQTKMSVMMQTKVGKGLRMQVLP